MKYPEVEGRRHRAGQHVEATGEEGISDSICAISISDPTGKAKAMIDLWSDWRWSMAMSSVARVWGKGNELCFSIFYFYMFKFKIQLQPQIE